MSTSTDWRTQRRMDEAARAEQARKNAVALAEIETAKEAARAVQARADADHRAETRRRIRAERDARRAAARARRSSRIAGLRRWAVTHVVDLLIYPLALVSAVMAVPAMAAYGYDLYQSGTGLALFFITELGMWAFSVAVHVTRHRHPERPVWALQVGVWSFTATGFGVNFGHGWQATDSLFVGLVMGLASVAGVIAHQLVTASPRRSRAERDTAAMAARVARKVAKVQRAAVRAAVAELDADGTARLVFAPGTYRLTRTPFTRRCRLAPAAPPALSESAGFTLPDTDPAAQADPATDQEAPARPARKRTTATRRKPARKLLADYVNDARASWSPGIEITPAWARHATGCSKGLSAKVAAVLRDEIAAAHPAALTVTTTPTPSTGREAA